MHIGAENNSNAMGHQNLFVVEKEIFLSFYAIRKIIESKKISNSITQRKHKLQEFPYSGDPKSIMPHMSNTEYDLGDGKNKLSNHY